MELVLSLDYWAATVGTFDPGKVVGMVQSAFPETIVDPLDHSAAEVERMSQFCETVPEPQRTTMIRQITRKAQDNGPTYNFEIPTDLGPVKGQARRYSVILDLPNGTGDELRGRLVAFLKELKLGEPRIDELAGLDEG